MSDCLPSMQRALTSMGTGSTLTTLRQNLLISQRRWERSWGGFTGSEDKDCLGNPFSDKERKKTSKTQLYYLQSC